MTWPGPNATPDDYPQFMGDSDHTGWARTEAALTTSTVDSLGVLRAVANEGSGYAPATGSPVVVGSGVYLGGARLSRYDASTGRRVWSRSIGRPIQTTPAYAHGRVVVVGNG